MCDGLKRPASPSAQPARATCCPMCHGKRRIWYLQDAMSDPTQHSCPTCRGIGTVPADPPAPAQPAQKRATCPRCGGSGWQAPIALANRCELCRGVGTVPAADPTAPAQPARATCPHCHGTGYDTPGKEAYCPCHVCGGTGTGTVPADPPAPAQPAPSAPAYPGCSLFLAEVQEWVAGLPPGWEGPGVLADLVMTCRRANRDGIRLAEAVAVERKRQEGRP